MPKMGIQPTRGGGQKGNIETLDSGKPGHSFYGWQVLSLGTVQARN